MNILNRLSLGLFRYFAVEKLPDKLRNSGMSADRQVSENLVLLFSGPNKDWSGAWFAFHVGG
jgi:hypothetical protein